MSKIEDIWAKIQESDDYSNYSDEVKEQVKQRFFERTIGKSEAYTSAPPDAQAKIQARFNERLNPSLTTTLKKDASQIGSIVKAEGGLGKTLDKIDNFTPMGKAAKYAGEKGHEFVEGMEHRDTTSLPGKAGNALSKGIEGAEVDLEDPKNHDLKYNDAAASNAIPYDAALETGKKLIEGVVPESKAGVRATVAAGPAEDIAKTLPILGADVGKAAESIIGKFRGEVKIPPMKIDAPLRSLLDDEKMYEQKLKEMAGLNGHPDYEPFTPEIRTNISQLHDYRKDQLMNMRAEEPHLKTLAGEEEKASYGKKLEDMSGGEEPQNFTPEAKTNVSQLKDFHSQQLSGLQQEQPKLGLLKGKEDAAAESGAYDAKLQSMPPVEREQEPLIKSPSSLQFGQNKSEIPDPDALKFPERNLSDITQKPGRNILRELNDDMTHIASKKMSALDNERGQIRFRVSDKTPVKAVGQDDYDVLNAAKDLRVAVKLPNGKVEVGQFGESHAEAFSKKIGYELMDQSVLGFYDNITNKFVSREDAADMLGSGRSRYTDQGYYAGPGHRDSLLGQELGDLHRAGTTYLGKSEKGLHSGDIANIKRIGTGELIKNINKEVGEKGHIWAEADPERYDRIKQNVRELLRRAHKVGYDGTDEVLSWAQRNYISKDELHFIKDELAHEEDSPLDPRPISEVLQAMKGGQDAKNTLWEKVKDRWTPDGKASKVKTILTKRYGEIAEGHVDSQFFIHNTFKQLTKSEREAMPFKGVAPESDHFKWPNKDEIIQLINKPSENMKKADKALSSYMAEAHKFLSDNFDDVGYVKDYVTQLWDKPNDVLLNPKSNEGGTYNPFVENRSYPNYAAGINAGETPKTLDMREIASIYDKYKIKSVANVRFFDELAQMPTPQGLPAVMPANRAPVGWIKANDVPALVGKRVHPDYLQAIKVITDAPFSNKALRAYDLMTEGQAYCSLIGSPFHFGSLFTISSLSTKIPFEIPLKVLSATGKYIVKETLADDSERSVWAKALSAYNEGHAAFIDLPFSKRAVRAGLNIGIIGKEQIGGLENFLMGTEAKLNKFYLGKGIKAIRGTMDILNKPLWDYAHAGIKIMTFQEHLLDNMKQFPDMPIQELERKTASYVNDLDGGQAWETLFTSPQYQKSLHRMFFFPDWLVSRMRSLGEVIKPVGLDSFKNATTRSPQAYQAQKFWLRAGLEYYTFANWRNYVNTKKAYGEGRFMWDNDPGKEFDVFSKTDEKGRAIYHDYAPAITMPFKLLQGPIKAIGTRFNPNLQLMTEFFTGTSLSGYKLPENQRSFASIIKRKAPMVFSGNNELGLFPGSKGMSSFDVVKRFEGVIKNGDDPAIAIKYGTQNGYDIEKLYNIAMRNVKGNMRKEAINQ